MTNNKSIVLLVTGLLWAGFAQAQESTNASGGDASGSGGTAAYSVGQVLYSTKKDASSTVTQGAQQPYEISLVTAIEESATNISLTYFPNPTTENLTLQISDYNKEKLSYQLFDTHGKQLSSGQIVQQQTQINMNALPPAIYFINLLNQENKKVQSFKVIKR